MLQFGVVGRVDPFRKIYISFFGWEVGNVCLVIFWLGETAIDFVGL